MKTTEDSDLVLEGLFIAERDGVYQQGEMEGEYSVQDMDSIHLDQGTSAVGGSWQGKVKIHSRTGNVHVYTTFA